MPNAKAIAPILTVIALISVVVGISSLFLALVAADNYQLNEYTGIATVIGTGAIVAGILGLAFAGLLNTIGDIELHLRRLAQVETPDNPLTEPPAHGTSVDAPGA